MPLKPMTRKERLAAQEISRLEDLVKKREAGVEDAKRKLDRAKRRKKADG